MNSAFLSKQEIKSMLDINIVGFFQFLYSLNNTDDTILASLLVFLMFIALLTR